MKKKYLSPELEWLEIRLVDVVLASKQNENQMIDISKLDPTEEEWDPFDDIDPNGGQS